MRIDQLPDLDPETRDLLAVIETPKGSRNKYDYDSGLRVFRIAAVLPLGTMFPYDFGFIPSTKADDGDPLDIMILMDETSPPGTVVTVRVLGAIEAEQREKEKDWVRNDRLLGIATHAHAHSHAASLKDLNPKMIEEIEAFFHHYNRLKGKEFRVVGHAGPRKAKKLIKKAKNK